jgi:cyanophycinase
VQNGKEFRMTNASPRSKCCRAVASILLALATTPESLITQGRVASAQEIPLLATLSTPSIASSNSSLSLAAIDENEHDRGALLLCGGGPLPIAVLELFFQYGKGEEGKLVIIPTASALADSGDFSIALGSWSDFNWGKVDVLHALDRAQAEVDDFAATLKDATAVWMTGGDQGRLAERYQGTDVEQEIRNVMNRGGVVGGTSAGSAIASRVMISGGQRQARIGDGLDLLPNAIIDQHFSQRSRFERLASAVAAHPERVGIGIDESTGLLVDKKRAQVIGDGAVYVYANYKRPIRVVKTDRGVEPEAEIDPAVTTAEFRTLRVAPGEVLESHGFPLLAPRKRE